MTEPVPLYALAHCRAGDKGNDLLLVVVPYAHQDFERLRKALTATEVARHFAVDPAERVTVTALLSVGALVIAVRDRLAGGVTRASGADPHGKTLSSHLLDWKLPAS